MGLPAWGSESLGGALGIRAPAFMAWGFRVHGLCGSGFRVHGLGGLGFKVVWLRAYFLELRMHHGCCLLCFVVTDLTLSS